jgi:hypothetical protein
MKDNLRQELKDRSEPLAMASTDLLIRNLPESISRTKYQELEDVNELLKELKKLTIKEEIKKEEGDKFQTKIM